MVKAMNKLTLVLELAMLLAPLAIAIIATLFIISFILIGESCHNHRLKKRKDYELNIDEVNKAAKEYFTKPYEENRESSAEKDKVIR